MKKYTLAVMILLCSFFCANANIINGFLQNKLMLEKEISINIELLNKEKSEKIIRQIERKLKHFQKEYGTVSIKYSNTEQLILDMNFIDPELFAKVSEVTNADGTLTHGIVRSLRDKYLLSIKAIYWKTKNAIVSFSDTDTTLVDNPGRGMLSHIPPIKHQYQALELSGAKIKGDHFTFMASYVLSRTEGNYNGFYDQMFESSLLGMNIQMETSDQIYNSDGLLPNDRTHQVKITANYKFDFGLSLGGFFSYYSGAPINEFGPSEFGFGRHTYLVTKGSAGRLPDIWDLNLRLLYPLKIKNSRARFFMDIYHLGNPRKVTKTYQVMYTGYLADDQGAPIRNEFGQPIPDPDTLEEDYGKALAFQPPTRIRFGLEVMLGN